MRAGLTLTEMAEALGADRKTLRLWEQGKRVPRDRARLDDLAQVLRLSAAEADQLAAAARSQRHYAVTERLVGAGRATDATPSLPIPGLLPHHQLRTPVGDFVGRIAEITELREALLAAASGSSAVITGVQGMGGIGKTELAYAVTHDLRSAFPDAQLVLALRGASATPLTPEQALQAVICAFTPEAKLPEKLEALEALYRSVLHDKRVLILADDAADAAQVRPLLPPAGCALLITSRTRFTLPAMTTIFLEQLCPAEAVGLLRQICARLSEADAQALGQACGYLPLALRISGSILHNDPALDVAEHLARLTDERQRFTLLYDPDDPALDVAASLTMSYAQLDAVAQYIFRQLGVLVADFTIELALAMVAVPAGVDVVAVLRQLLRRSLLMYDPQRLRWRLHDLMRSLALGLHEQAGEMEATWWRYAQAAVQATQKIEEQYCAGGDGMLVALAHFDVERPHLDAARRWAAAHAGTTAGDALLVTEARATYTIGSVRYMPRRERIPQLELALAAARRLGDRETEGMALNKLGISYINLGAAGQAIGYFEQRRALAYALGDRRGEAAALGNQGVAFMELGDPRRAIRTFEQGHLLVRGIGDRSYESNVLCNLAEANLQVGEPQQALAYLDRALAIIQALGDRRTKAELLRLQGQAYVDLGDARRALASFEQTLTIMRTLGYRYYEGVALSHLGHAALALGEIWRANGWCRDALEIFRAEGDQRQEGYTLYRLGAIYTALDDRSDAQAAFAQALALLRAVGDRWGEAQCSWAFGLILAGWGERRRALPLLCASVAYEQEIRHTKAAEHAALVALLEAGEDLPTELVPSGNQRDQGKRERTGG